LRSAFAASISTISLVFSILTWSLPAPSTTQIPACPPPEAAYDLVGAGVMAVESLDRPLKVKARARLIAGVRVLAGRGLGLGEVFNRGPSRCSIDHC
jgi:hypothetical protein